MTAVLVRAALASYPPWWRHRYAQEAADLTAELAADPGARPWRFVVSLLVGSMGAWMQVRRWRHYLQPIASPNQWGFIPRGSHRDVLGNRGLWPRSEAELRPGEVLLGVIDGTCGSNYLLNMRRQGWILLVVPPVVSLAGQGTTVRITIMRLTLGAVFLTVGWAGVAVTKSREVAVAVTSEGIVVFRRHPFSGRTGKMVSRIPAVSPELVRVGAFGRRKVRLGDRTVWVGGGSDQLLHWMSRSWWPWAG